MPQNVIMVTKTKIVVPNDAARWYSIAYWLIWAFGLYGKIETGLWPPSSWHDGLSYVGLILVPVVAIRTMRARVILDEHGFVSFGDFRCRKFTWAEVRGFSVRGNFIQRKVGVDLVDGRWVRLQYHPFAADMLRQLEVEQKQLS